MNSPGDYEGLDMSGLLPCWYEYVVPADVQKNVIAAIPEVRVIWNNLIKRFQVVYRNASSVVRYWDGGFMRGWEILAFEFPSPLLTDKVVGTLRKWEDFNRTLKDKGFKDMEDFIDRRLAQVGVDSDSKMDEICDEFFGTAGSAIKRGNIVSRPYAPRIIVPRKVAQA